MSGRRARLDRKVPGGKLLRVEVELSAGPGPAGAADGATVARAAVRGDFFAHPEELFEAAEASLAGLPAEALRAAAMAAFSTPGLEIFGASAADIADALAEACAAAIGAGEPGAPAGGSP